MVISTVSTRFKGTISVTSGFLRVLPGSAGVLAMNGVVDANFFLKSNVDTEFSCKSSCLFITNSLTDRI